MAANATKFAAKNSSEDCLAPASIPVMLDPPPLRPHASSPLQEASASTFGLGHHLGLDSDDEDVDEVLVRDSPPLLPRPGGSQAHPSSPPLNAPLLEQAVHGCSSPNSSTTNLHDSMDTPPPPPPLNRRRPQPDDNLIVPSTPESEPVYKTSPTYTDVVKRSSSGKNHHQQPQGHKLKSIIIDPSRHEVPPRRAGRRVRFADSPHPSPSAMQSSCSASSGINSSWNTLREAPRVELHSSPTGHSSNDRRTARLSSRIRKITEGRCFICLARGHWAVACRDPITCFRCRRPGHRERDCRQRHHHPHQSVMPCHPPLPQHLPREAKSTGHQNDCHKERLHLRSDDSALQHFVSEHTNYLQHKIMKMLDAKIQSLCSEFSLLLSAQLQKFQESNEKWMKLMEKLVLQSGAMTNDGPDDISSGDVNQVTMQAHGDRLNQLHDTPFHPEVARREATTTIASQEPKSLGDEHHRSKESGSPVKVATTTNKSAEVTIQDVEDVLLQIENAAAKEPPMSLVSCCSPTHTAGRESDSLLLSLGSTNVEPSCPAMQLEEQKADSTAQTLGLGTVEATTPTLELATSSHVLTCHQLKDTELAKAASEPTARHTSRRCRYRQGCVYTRRPRYGSRCTRRGFGAVDDTGPCRDNEGQSGTMPPSPEDGGQSAHEVALTNFIQLVTKPIQQPLLPPPQHGPVKPRKEKKRPGKPSRRSARLAAIAWPRGDAQSRARQVLMKKLGVTQEEGETKEMMFLRCVNLIKGTPMSDLVFKALEDLSGLDSKCS